MQPCSAMMASALSTTFQMCSTGWRSGDRAFKSVQISQVQWDARSYRFTEHTVMFRKAVSAHWSFVTWFNILLEVATGRWLQHGHKQIYVVRINAYTKISRCWVAQNAPARSPPTPPALSELLTQGLMDSCFHVVYITSWPYQPNVTVEIGTRQTIQCSPPPVFSPSIVQLWCSFANCILRFLFFTDMSGTQGHCGPSASTVFNISLTVLCILWKQRVADVTPFMPSFIFLTQTTMDTFLQPFVLIWIFVLNFSLPSLPRLNG